MAERCADCAEHIREDDPYGQRVPEMMDARALVDMLKAGTLTEETRALVEQAVASYCRQFRGVE